MFAIMISYTLVCTNTDTAQLAEPLSASPTRNSLRSTATNPTGLAPGAALTCTGVYTLTLGRFFIAAASGKRCDCPCLTRRWLCRVPAWSRCRCRRGRRWSRPAAPTEVTIGDTIDYTLMTVQNTGNLPLTGTVVLNPKLGLTRNRWLFEYRTSPG